MKFNISVNLLDKYLKGKCSKEEISLIEKWYQSYDENDDLLSALSPEEQDRLKQTMFNRIDEKIHTEPESLPRGSFTKSLVYISSGIAAAFLLFFAFQYQNIVPVKDEFSVKKSDEAIVYNSTKTILRQALSDGSIVWLNPGTKIKYQKIFGHHKREVQMSGDAFFEVAKDKTRPFIIESGGVTTKVLGTSFRIKAMENELSTEVFVLTGKVNVKVNGKNGQFQNGTDEVTLLPKQAIIFLKDQNLLLKKAADEKPLKIWQKTQLSFNNVPVSEVLKSINEEFGVKIVCKDAAVAKYVIKADFNGQNLADVLEILKSSLNISYEFNNEEIELK